ncbi:MAG: hypothetical protein M9891_09585 [Austwickia sp.]|nr:hypothetical protein [Austwickia sp.]
MSAELFLDTNIFIYAVDTTDAAKREVADQLIRDTLAAGNGTTSYQVAEFPQCRGHQGAHPPRRRRGPPVP